MQSAKVQRWPPEELLRTLVEAEIAARDESNARARLRSAGFPVTKTIAEFNVGQCPRPPGTTSPRSSGCGPPRTFCLVGPAGTGKSHALIALGHAAVAAGMRVRYFAAAELVETLYRGMADNSVAKIIDSLLRADLIICDELGFAPLDLASSQLLFRFVAAAYERRSLGIASHWPLRGVGTFPPRAHHGDVAARPPSAPRRHGRHRRRELPHARSPAEGRTPFDQGLMSYARGGDFRWPPARTSRWPLTYGRRKLAAAARRAGLDVGRDQVTRLMRAEGIRGATRSARRFTTRSDPAAVPSPDLLKRDFTVTRPNEKWVANFTYCSTWSGIVYIAFVTDVYSRRIVGWKASRTMATGLVVAALNMAAWCAGAPASTASSVTAMPAVNIGAGPHRPPGRDRRRPLYRQRRGFLRQRPRRVVIGLFKTELLRNPAAIARNGGPWRGLDDLDLATCAWVGWFNEERIHGELGSRRPPSFEAEYGRRPQPSAA